MDEITELQLIMSKALGHRVKVNLHNRDKFYGECVCYTQPLDCWRYNEETEEFDEAGCASIDVRCADTLFELYEDQIKSVEILD